MCNKISNEFNIKNMGDYHVLKVDPCHYFSFPGLSWDAMLKMTGAKLEKIFGIKMYLFIQKGLGEGIFFIAKRRSEANNKYMQIYRQNIYRPLIWTIWMVRLWVDIFLMGDLSG